MNLKGKKTLSIQKQVTCFIMALVMTLQLCDLDRPRERGKREPLRVTNSSPRPDVTLLCAVGAHQQYIAAKNTRIDVIDHAEESHLNTFPGGSIKTCSAAAAFVSEPNEQTECSFLVQ